MLHFLLDHLPSCKPPGECPSCTAAAILKQKLTKDEYDAVERSVIDFYMPKRLKKRRRKQGAKRTKRVPTKRTKSAKFVRRLNQRKPAPKRAKVRKVAKWEDVFGDDLSTRTKNILRNDNVVTIGDLVKKTKADLLKLPNFGRMCLDEMVKALAKHGHTLKEEKK